MGQGLRTAILVRRRPARNEPRTSFRSSTYGRFLGQRGRRRGDSRCGMGRRYTDRRRPTGAGDLEVPAMSDRPSEPNPTVPVCLTIAGSDSSGGAGIQGDLKTFAALGVYGASALTALTAQNTQGVQAICPVDPAFVRRQIDSVFADLPVRAAKTGMLASTPVIAAVAEALSAQAEETALVVDPVVVARSGDVLLEPDALQALRTMILPLATVITPNPQE